MDTPAHFDVVIIGAGISGINTAYHLQNCAPKGTTYSYTILEARDKLGGTWDLFKYPGVRSDSDLFTFGFYWWPWTAGLVMAEAPAILEYMQEATEQNGIDKNIRFAHHVRSASWSSDELVWTLNVQKGDSGTFTEFTAGFIVFGTGYYDHTTPLSTVIPGIDKFDGRVVHPQFWPSDLDYTDKDVVIIGSGATAVTLLPNVAKEARKTTMVQRSPTYIIGIPNQTPAPSWFSRLLSKYLFSTLFSHRIARWQQMFDEYYLYYFCRYWPKQAMAYIKDNARQYLSPAIPHDTHFSPTYNPWDQRLCLAPDGDFYQALGEKASIVTGNIESVVPNGLLMQNGETISADIIVTATGLKMNVGGLIDIYVDGKPYTIPSKHLWRGMMLDGLPNAAFIFGYSNASWTVGADVTAKYLLRILETMHKKKAGAVIPRVTSEMQPRPFLNLDSTYVKKASERLPITGDSGPWRPRSNYFMDMAGAMWGGVDDGLEYLQSPMSKH